MDRHEDGGDGINYVTEKPNGVMQYDELDLLKKDGKKSGKLLVLFFFSQVHNHITWLLYFKSI